MARARPAKRCAFGGALVRLEERIPTAHYERGLHELGVGCNHLRCKRCKTFVRREQAFYRCGCEERVAEDLYLERQRHEPMDPPHVTWRCHGHPPPTDAEFDAMGYTADVAADVLGRLTEPAEPHHSRIHYGYAADLRLEWTTAAERRAVYRRLRPILEGDSPREVAAAMDLLRYRGALPMDEPVRWWSHLTQIANPSHPKQDLGSRYESYVARLAREGGPDSEAMAAAKLLASELGEDGRYVRHVV